MMLSRVDLPAPDGPVIASHSPDAAQVNVERSVNSQFTPKLAANLVETEDVIVVSQRSHYSVAGSRRVCVGRGHHSFS